MRSVVVELQQDWSIHSHDDLAETLMAALDKHSYVIQWKKTQTHSGPFTLLPFQLRNIFASL